jgi:hypothetical protein
MGDPPTEGPGRWSQALRRSGALDALDLERVESLAAHEFTVRALVEVSG